jgi:hypothetical protein
MTVQRLVASASVPVDRFLAGLSALPPALWAAGTVGHTASWLWAMLRGVCHSVDLVDTRLIGGGGAGAEVLSAIPTLPAGTTTLPMRFRVFTPAPGDASFSPEAPVVVVLAGHQGAPAVSKTLAAWPHLNSPSSRVVVVVDVAGAPGPPERAAQVFVPYALFSAGLMCAGDGVREVGPLLDGVHGLVFGHRMLALTYNGRAASPSSVATIILRPLPSACGVVDVPVPALVHALLATHGVALGPVTCMLAVPGLEVGLAPPSYCPTKTSFNKSAIPLRPPPLQGADRHALLALRTTALEVGAAVFR